MNFSNYSLAQEIVSDYKLALSRVNTKSGIVITRYDYTRLGVQMFDTVKFFCSENHHYQDRYVSSEIYKGFFLGFEQSLYEFGFGFKGFKGLCVLLPGKKLDKNLDFVKLSNCNCEIHSDLKYVKVLPTRMVLIEKVLFNI